MSMPGIRAQGSAQTWQGGDVLPIQFLHKAVRWPITFNFKISVARNMSLIIQPLGQSGPYPLTGTASCYRNTNSTSLISIIMIGRLVSLDSSHGSLSPLRCVAHFSSASAELGCSLSFLAVCCFANGKIFEVLFQCLRLCFLSTLRTLHSSQNFPLSHSLSKKEEAFSK